MTASKLKLAVQRIERWMTDNGAPLLAENLAAGASEATLDKAEKKLGFQIPDELRALWRLHHGQKEEMNGFVESLDLFDSKLALGEKSTVDMFLEFLREHPDSWQEAGVTPDEAESDRWIPFAGRNSDLLVISAVTGRIFSCGKDVPPLRLLAGSLTQWAEQYARRVEAGDYAVEEGFGDYYLQLRDREREEHERELAARRAEAHRLANIAPTQAELDAALKNVEDGSDYQVLVERAQRASPEAFARTVALLFERKTTPDFVATALQPVLGAISLTPDQWIDVAEGGAHNDNNTVQDIALARGTGRSAQRVAQLERTVKSAEDWLQPRLQRLLDRVRAL